MVLQTRTRTGFSKATDEAWQALFLVGGGDDPATDGSASLGAWAAEDLVAEAILRSADDIRSLRRMQRQILHALLGAVDRKSARTANGR
jgi:hypothetical protein